MHKMPQSSEIEKGNRAKPRARPRTPETNFQRPSTQCRPDRARSAPPAQREFGARCHSPQSASKLNSGTRRGAESGARGPRSRSSRGRTAARQYLSGTMTKSLLLGTGLKRFYHYIVIDRTRLTSQRGKNIVSLHYLRADNMIEMNNIGSIRHSGLNTPSRLLETSTL